MSNFAFITVCSGRLHHLRRTMPLMIAAKPDEIIVVDYDCQDNTADWVNKNYPDVTTVRAHDPEGLCISRGRNIGAEKANSEWLCFVDADILIKPGWLDWMRNKIEDNCFFTIDMHDHTGSYGTFFCRKSEFLKVGGFDEIFRSWGGEDADMYNRLELSGLNRCYYPSGFIEAIQHSDRERNIDPQQTSRSAQRLVDHLYNHLVTGIFGHSLEPLEFCCRKNLHDQVSNLVAQKYVGNRLPSYRFSGEFDLHCAKCREAMGNYAVIRLVRRRQWYLFGRKIWEYSLTERSNFS